MEIVPPSYESATTRDALSIIAPYIPSSDLCAATLVCSKWHTAFMPFLWGNPASHFGTENDEVYVALTRFRRTLKYARLEVRMLTHTIHMPPALSEIYGGPRPEWLRDIFEYLPHLQSLIVSQLPFFDHNSMVALRGAGSSSLSSRTYNIRLLIAQREPNTTSLGLAETLLRFPGLIYLDLSYTTSAKDQTVLSTLSQLEHLQVLKLRGIGLKDIDAAYLANAIGHRVRLLDLRGNKLTDMALQSLLQACFLPPGHAAYTRASKLLRSPVVDEKFRKALTSPLTGRSWVEDLPSAGITHLYLADNQFTVDGVASLLTTGRLHVLDVGTVDTEKHLNESLISAEQRVYPGSEKLIPILGTVAKDNLTYLRAHHPICTSIAPHGRSPPAEDLLPELSAGDGTAGFNELDSSTAEIHELPADTTPVFELSGSSPRPKSPITPRDDVVASFREFQEDPGLQIDERRRSAIAPEVLYGPNETDGTTSPSVGFSALSTSPIPLCNSPISMEDSRGRKIQELLAKRPKSQPRRNGRQSYVDYLHPFQVPHLEVLVLTDVPSHVPADSPILESLMQFIIACSNEALLATLQAGSDYSLPPGQDRAKAEQERARSLFGLRQLVLEITPITKSLNNFNSSTWKSVSAQIGNQKSTTGDWDLERLWSAASDDFSFFGEPECGVPKGKNQPGFRTSNPSFTPAPAPIVDLASELAAFRRRKKSEYEQTIRQASQRRNTVEALSPQSYHSAGSARGLSPSPSARASSPVLGSRLSIAHHVEGHWKGEIKIVRNATPKGRSGMVDMYGNYFEKGYLYP
ncbi:hypothetical protein ASPSYDRAFT_150388 [Aspergillus sydowii CBS 593.65]|uniref:F-box domain-containing protein n=1 Tax=Aspergillus sydowii CBS 593.65 TaxID=1036612 RepID=A0A1L9TIW3_9EURO|nr:uncharacterized protein ASPSYDRAFT_150388 [Aspergillus sydowii CBS 593.65]OJJ59374.1 hypothetical protein ASPSYDRAFT_150388 [Aspergillus sydowii CBS 593.65]